MGGTHAHEAGRCCGHANLPERIERIASKLRAAGRTFWWPGESGNRLSMHANVGPPLLRPSPRLGRCSQHARQWRTRVVLALAST